MGRQSVVLTNSVGENERRLAHAPNPYHQRVSVILIYPDNGWHTVIDPSEDLTTSLSQMQKWWLTSRLPNKQGTGHSAMVFFNRYARQIDHHVANVRKIKPGISGDLLSFLISLPFILWFLISMIRNRHLIWENPGPSYYNSGFGSYMYGWWQGRHH